MELSSEDAALRVKRGAVALDETFPGWAQQMDLDGLVMETCDTCVLGQVGWAICGDHLDPYGEAVRSLSDSEGVPEGPRFTITHGFDLSADEAIAGHADVSWQQLADAWRAEIKQRI